MKATEGQTIFDISAQELGTIDNLVRDVLIPNSLTFYSDINGGQFLISDNEGKGRKDVKDYFFNNNIKPTNT